METRPKLMLFSHVCNTRSITGAEKLLLHFMREMGTIFDCVLVVPREGKLAGLAQRSGSGSRSASSRYYMAFIRHIRALGTMLNNCAINLNSRPWFP